MSMSPTEMSSSVVRERRKKPLSGCVEAALVRYFKDLDGHAPAGDLYQMVISEVERPLLAAVMQHARGNQSLAAEILGINRGTLRKKLQQYGLE
ncbi:MAG: DNA-binding transcriptional regulator Fis [Gammaproteobacteria bacterium]|nr:DNA-binding transcriptional regulator Fis [Gammaproteobacteria bacterium]